MLLTSTKASGIATDALSDYDIILCTSEPDTLMQNDSWLTVLGEILVQLPYREKKAYTTEPYRLVIYKDGTKVDYSIIDLDTLKGYATTDELPQDLDIGYQVLLDKDGLTAPMKLPSFEAFTITKPTQDEFTDVVKETFFLGNELCC